MEKFSDWGWRSLWTLTDSAGSGLRGSLMESTCLLLSYNNLLYLVTDESSAALSLIGCWELGLSTELLPRSGAAGKLSVLMLTAAARPQCQRETWWSPGFTETPEGTVWSDWFWWWTRERGNWKSNCPSSTNKQRNKCSLFFLFFLWF